jgi:hypothetical protein
MPHFVLIFIARCSADAASTVLVLPDMECRGHGGLNIPFDFGVPHSESTD